MYGLVNRTIEQFALDAHGDSGWAAVAAGAGLDPRGFDLLTHYQPGLNERLLGSLAAHRGCTPCELAEDIGAWLAQRGQIRYLLRFGGREFADFVMSLEELPGRIQLVVRGMAVPPIKVRRLAQGCRITSGGDRVWLHALAGVLHAMADDYGVLAVIEVDRGGITVDVPLVDFNEARPFSISDPNVGAA